jgi:hypothetical protein
LSYEFSESLLGYGTVSTGFRSVGVNAVSGPFEPIPGVSPEAPGAPLPTLAHPLRRGTDGVLREP